jgi:hypothetical protein
LILEIASGIAATLALLVGCRAAKQASTVDEHETIIASVPVESVLDKINSVVESASSAGHLVRKIFVGTDCFSELCRNWGRGIGMTPAGPMIITAHGGVPVELRPTLVNAVIAEDTTGEPWISE